VATATAGAVLTRDAPEADLPAPPPTKHHVTLCKKFRHMAGPDADRRP
jgi:hypothetical protein